MGGFEAIEPSAEERLFINRFPRVKRAIEAGILRSGQFPKGELLGISNLHPDSLRDMEDAFGAVRVLKGHFGERLVCAGLFGSVARTPNESHRHSDIDLLAVVTGWAGKTDALEMSEALAKISPRLSVNFLDRVEEMGEGEVVETGNLDRYQLHLFAQNVVFFYGIGAGRRIEAQVKEYVGRLGIEEKEMISKALIEHRVSNDCKNLKEKWLADEKREDERAANRAAHRRLSQRTESPEKKRRREVWREAVLFRGVRAIPVSPKESREFVRMAIRLGLNPKLVAVEKARYQKKRAVRA